MFATDQVNNLVTICLMFFGFVVDQSQGFTHARQSLYFWATFSDERQVVLKTDSGIHSLECYWSLKDTYIKLDISDIFQG
jgi:hypothetical protein